MTPQEFKVVVNLELDARSQRFVGRIMTFQERRAWWTSPQGDIKEPYLTGFGTEDEQQAVLKAAREWEP